jgi:hypothetical protein
MMLCFVFGFDVCYVEEVINFNSSLENEVIYKGMKVTEERQTKGREDKFQVKERSSDNISHYCTNFGHRGHTFLLIINFNFLLSK